MCLLRVMIMEAGNGAELNWLNLAYKWKLSLFNNYVSNINNVWIWDENKKCLCVPVPR